MFTAPLLRQDRSVPGDRIDGTLGSILFSQREFNGWLEQKPFIPTQEYVAGCRQREKIGFNDVFLHIWKGSAPELWTSGIEWTTFYGSFLKRYIQNLAGLPSEQDFFNFMRLVAARIGQRLNFRTLSGELVVQSINTLSIKQMRTQCLQASISSGRSPVPHSLA